MSIKYTGEARLLSAESKPYDFMKEDERLQGTSHRIRLNIGGEIYAFKSTAEVVEKAKALVGEDVEVEVEVVSPKEVLGIKLVSLEEAE